MGFGRWIKQVKAHGPEKSRMIIHQHHRPSPPALLHLFLLGRHGRLSVAVLPPVCKDLVLAMEKLGENWASVSAPIISILLLAIDLSSAYLDQLKKKHSKSNDRLKLQEELKLLLKEANALSGPSTFAQSAKLKRQAAAKEKELERINEVSTREARESYNFYFAAIRFFKVLIYVVSIWCFWNSPVASIAQQQLVPFGKVLSWRSGNRVFGHVTVGILPWLMLNSRLSNLISRKAFPV